MEKEVFLQARNVAQLPGLAGPVCLMPDAHCGYGAPIGTVFAMDKNEGFVSPGAVGYDINCGMRLMMTNLSYEEVRPLVVKLISFLFDSVPAGVGGKGFLRVNKDELQKLVENGVSYLVATKGIGWEDDINHIEENGLIKGADFSCVSEKAAERGVSQLATLGSGNHYLEIQKVENIFDKETAKKWGIIEVNQIGIMIHCGSRGFGHQICSDYLRIFEKHLPEFKIKLSDRQLVAAPINSPFAKNYLSAMAGGANFAFVNREAITHKVREVFEKVFGKKAKDLNMRLVYDVAHNMAKFEGDFLIHRKGATRSFPGQPVIIGGSMETGSYLLVGEVEAMKKSYGSTAHGSGRTMSRAAAKKIVHGKDLWQKMKKEGIYVKSASLSGLAEEAGLAYKNISDVVKSIETAGLSKPVAYFKPIGNIKG
jgi:tRNA-splicing ligase RtcB